ncbi:hypothetical protein RFI_24061 [Reticulomyxa filosa]|uniref:Uncharacterized protein n=1 Tax=Reticulomyxa filosa TaxID=46433 RepID=X6MHF7_RETFI|nr:hypothetical protein RFI_24061 [Reticulomyxa filosa]|eukprot:ETO13314.1 hypothetical protein RFI_24061 [Reticulomyxa filosa]
MGPAPYQGKYTLIQAVNKRKKEIEKERSDEKKDAAEPNEITTTCNAIDGLSSNTVNGSTNEKGTLVLDKNENSVGSSIASQVLASPSVPSSGNCNPVKAQTTRLTNLFDCRYVRIRKVYGGSVKEMFFDDKSLARNILERDEVTLAIERAEIEEYFTSQHLCFWLHRYRMDDGGIYGKIFQKVYCSFIKFFIFIIVIRKLFV